MVARPKKDPGLHLGLSQRIRFRLIVAIASGVSRFSLCIKGLSGTVGVGPSYYVPFLRIPVVHWGFNLITGQGFTQVRRSKIGVHARVSFMLGTSDIGGLKDV